MIFQEIRLRCAPGAAALLLILSYAGYAQEPEAGAEEGAEAAEAAPPKIVCDEPLYDFGTVASGATVEHTWTLRNEGGQPLEITRVKAGCGCTTAGVEKKTVEPGEETKVTASLSLANRKGGQKKWVLVESNDPAKKGLTLWFQGRASVPVSTVPEKISYGLLGTNPEQVRKVKVNAGTEESFKVTEVDTGTPHLEANVTTLKEDKEYEIEVTTTGGALESDLETVVVIHTDSEKHATFEIPAALSVGLGEVAVAPEKFVVPAEGDGVLTRQVLVGAPGLESFKVTRVEAPLPEMRFMIAKLKPNQYRVQIKNITPDPSLDGLVVRIRTDLEGRPLIEVPFEVQ